MKESILSSYGLDCDIHDEQLLAALSEPDVLALSLGACVHPRTPAKKIQG